MQADVSDTVHVHIVHSYTAKKQNLERAPHRQQRDLSGLLVVLMLMVDDDDQARCSLYQ